MILQTTWKTRSRFLLCEAPWDLADISEKFLPESTSFNSISGTHHHIFSSSTEREFESLLTSTKVMKKGEETWKELKTHVMGFSAFRSNMQWKWKHQAGPGPLDCQCLRCKQHSNLSESWRSEPAATERQSKRRMSDPEVTHELGMCHKLYTITAHRLFSFLGPKQSSHFHL